MDPLAVSVKDAARSLGCGRTSIYMMISDGRLEAFKLGRRTLIRMASVRRLVETSTPLCGHYEARERRA